MTTLTELGYESLDYDEIVFPNLGIDVKVDPTAFTVFGIDVQWYGILITAGLLLALLFAFRNLPRVGIDPDRATDAVIAGILGGLVGARAYYVLMNWKDYVGDWKLILNTREGGLAIFGGLIGAVLVGGIMCRIRKVKLLPMLDICGVGFLIGQGIGRWGNFTNQEAFGTNTNNLLCMSGGRIRTWIAQNYNSLTQLNSDVTVDPDYPVHPCFLYESVWCLLGALVLATVLRRFRRFDGEIILLYCIWYGLGRFFIEGLRTDSLMIGSLRVSQALAACICVTAAVLLIVFLSKVKRMGREYRLYVDTDESKALLEEAAKRSQKKKKGEPVQETSVDASGEDALEEASGDTADGTSEEEATAEDAVE